MILRLILKQISDVISMVVIILEVLQKGEAKVKIIIPDQVVFQSSHLLSLSIQRQIDTVDITILMSVIYFSLNTQGLD